MVPRRARGGLLRAAARGAATTRCHDRRVLDRDAEQPRSARLPGERGAVSRMGFRGLKGGSREAIGFVAAICESAICDVASYCQLILVLN